ncbi:MAG: DUF192 domain-containing protein [Dehalococcoidales bacterium]|nr:DUF192 domain-containing protein [Dehalococcoidales bacterium]
MLGQATLIIQNTTWQVSIAADPVDLTQGLGGLASIEEGTGELFDLGASQTIQVTTVPMLFALDIAFLDENLVVTEVYRDIQPGYMVTSQQPARYFLEVNAGELASVNPGDQAAAEITLPPVISTSGSGWLDLVNSFMPLIMGLALFGMLIPLVKSLFSEETKEPQLLASNRMKDHTCKKENGKFRIKTDRMGNLIITHSQRPGRDIFLQFESDKELVDSLLRRGEKRDLNAGWPVEILESEPRVGTLEELWEVSCPEPQQKTSPKVIQGHTPGQNLDYLPDSQEFLAYTIEDIGYREKIDRAFQEAIQRARRS